MFLIDSKIVVYLFCFLHHPICQPTGLNLVYLDRTILTTFYVVLVTLVWLVEASETVATVPSYLATSEIANSFSCSLLCLTALVIHSSDIDSKCWRITQSLLTAVISPCRRELSPPPKSQGYLPRILGSKFIESLFENLEKQTKWANVCLHPIQVKVINLLTKLLLNLLTYFVQLKLVP